MPFNKKQEPASNKKFGLLISVIFIASFFYFEEVPHKYLSLALATIFFMLSLIKPELLKYINSAWHKFGLLLGKFTNPIILGIIFYLIITPFALALKLGNRDLLRLKKKKADSYWVDRHPKNQPQTSFRDQY